MTTTSPVSRLRHAGPFDATTRRTLVRICATVVLVRLVFAWQPLRSDEGGYLMVARAWSDGEFLYGDYHVDRPPLLMLLFRSAALVGWDGAIRLLVIPFVLVTVLAAARAGQRLGGAAGARWAAVVAAALSCSPALAADQADGELFAAAFVMVSVLAALHAWQATDGSGGRLRWSVLAGLAGGAAPLVKQNFVEGLLFVAVLVLAETVRQRQLGARAVVLCVGTVAGAAVPYLLVGLWAAGAGFDGLRLWTDLAAFRGDAFSVIARGTIDAPRSRAVALAAMSVASGMVPLAWAWLRSCRDRHRRLDPVDWAVSAGLAYGVFAILAGGSYWLHYLVQLVPMLALAAALAGTARSWTAPAMRRAVTGTAAAAALAVAVTTVVYAALPRVWFQERTGEWLAASSVAGDDAVVAYGAPSVLEAADLPSPYPYLWSLPMRTLDPELARLRATLAGPDAPVWIVQMTSFNAWQIDAGGRLRAVVRNRYRKVAEPCGRTVWLRVDVERRLAPLPDC